MRFLEEPEPESQWGGKPFWMKHMQPPGGHHMPPPPHMGMGPGPMGPPRFGFPLCPPPFMNGQKVSSPVAGFMIPNRRQEK